MADEHAAREAGVLLGGVGEGGAEWERVRAPATECSRITQEFLEEERRDEGERWFRQEYLCEFLETDEQVFRDDLIERALTDRVKPLIFDWRRQSQ